MTEISAVAHETYHTLPYKGQLAVANANLQVTQTIGHDWGTFHITKAAQDFYELGARHSKRAWGGPDTYACKIDAFLLAPDELKNMAASAQKGKAADAIRKAMEHPGVYSMAQGNGKRVALSVAVDNDPKLPLRIFGAVSDKEGLKPSTILRLAEQEPAKLRRLTISRVVGEVAAMEARHYMQAKNQRPYARQRNGVAAALGGVIAGASGIDVIHHNFGLPQLVLLTGGAAALGFVGYACNTELLNRRDSKDGAAAKAAAQLGARVRHDLDATLEHIPKQQPVEALESAEHLL